jgi:hypothetical protein
MGINSRHISPRYGWMMIAMTMRLRTADRDSTYRSVAATPHIPTPVCAAADPRPPQPPVTRYFVAGALIISTAGDTQLRSRGTWLQKMLTNATHSLNGDGIA